MAIAAAEQPGRASKLPGDGSGLGAQTAPHAESHEAAVAENRQARQQESRRADGSVNPQPFPLARNAQGHALAADGRDEQHDEQGL